MIKTKRLIIAPAGIDDITEILIIEHDPYNSQFTWTGTYEDHKNEILDQNSELLTVTRIEDDEIIGYVIIDIDKESEWLEIRRTALSDKGKGYGREMFEAILKYAFTIGDFNKVWLECYDDNPVGMHLYPSLGFHCDGVLRQHHKEKRGLLNEVQFSMLKGEYGENESVSV